MREKEDKQLEHKAVLHNEPENYSDCAAIDYCGFRLKSLAEKIKSGCLRIKKQKFVL